MQCLYPSTWVLRKWLDTERIQECQICLDLFFHFRGRSWVNVKCSSAWSLLYVELSTSYKMNHSKHILTHSATARSRRTYIKRGIVSTATNGMTSNLGAGLKLETCSSKQSSFLSRDQSQRKRVRLVWTLLYAELSLLTAWAVTHTIPSRRTRTQPFFILRQSPVKSADNLEHCSHVWSRVLHEIFRRPLSGGTGRGGGGRENRMNQKRDKKSRR